MIKDGSAPIRILSAGCSSGEEPYSLVMSLKERYGETLPRLCRFTAVDIDSSILARAREGKYGSFSFRGVPEAIRERYFTRVQRGWQITDDIRKLVEFRELNLLEGDDKNAPRGFDIVFFRNVSIYFDEAIRLRILKYLHSLMNPESILLTGVSETIANNLGVFEMVEENGLFYFAKGKVPLPETDAGPLLSSTSSMLSRQPERTADAPEKPLPLLKAPESWVTELEKKTDDFSEIYQLAIEGQYIKALPLVEARLSSEPENIPFLLLKSWLMLEKRQFQEAIEAADSAILLDPWSIDAFFLLGLAAKWQDLQEEATSQFKQAVYACHTCWPARYHLAEIFRRSGMEELARREYRAALGQIFTNPSDNGLKVIPPGITAQEARQICERRLSGMEGDRTGKKPDGN